MRIRPHTLVSITLGILLLSSTFFVGVTAQVNPYDPWVDINDDGEIDIFDIVQIAGAYGTTGTPINKTDLLLELLVRVQVLENQSGWLPAPVYDSGWTQISRSEIIVFQHGLNSTNLLVYIIGKTASDGTINQWMYGGVYNDNHGVAWYGLNSSHITVQRFPNDNILKASWDEVRVQIWKILQP